MIDCDCKSIIYSYLTFEEIVIIYSGNILKIDPIIKNIYKKKPDIDCEAEAGNLNAVQYLIHTQKPTTYALNCSAQNGHLSMVQYLMHIGLKPDNYTLMSAVGSGNLALVQLIISCGIVLDAKIICSAICSAIKYNRLNMVKYFITEKTKSREIMSFACQYAKIEIFKYIFEQGFIVYTANLIVAKKFNPEVFKYLRSNGVLKNNGRDDYLCIKENL
jgi:hypothetical protein